MEAIVWIVLGLVLVSFFLPNIEAIIFVIGLFFGAISSLLNLFTYIGASCQLVQNIEASFILVGLGFIFIAFYKSFFNSN